MTRHRELLESAELGGAVPDLRRRRAGDRRPGGPQPRHDRRLAVPGRSVRGPVRGVYDAGRELRDPRAVRHRVVTWTSSTGARTRRPSATARSSPRCGSRSGPVAPARTTRSSAEPATGRSCPPGAAVWIEDGVIVDARVGLAAVGPNTTGIPAISEALRGNPPSEELFRQAGSARRGGCEPVTDMRGAPSTSGIWPRS